MLEPDAHAQQVLGGAAPRPLAGVAVLEQAEKSDEKYVNPMDMD